VLLAFLGIVAAAIPNRAVRLTAQDHSGNATLVLIAGAEGPIAQIGFAVPTCRDAAPATVFTTLGFESWGMEPKNSPRGLPVCR